ncbi:hypothetical protein [Fusobacterium mortiferum]|uniref:Uncharacterized protein n=1 Tax=Fusobacterium mortiferum TaxID=850 RepID=A0ABS2G5G7_FUSMR|nr:hypothetical protein [Fusobacterium mortiferum]MBM6876122.1 hypothetical protein [Fusobacterium mortiferum]
MIIKFNSNLILWETEKALLVKLPKTDYQFWITKKLVKFYGKSSYQVNMFVPEGFQVKIQKMGKGQYNKNTVIEEKILNYNEFIKYFGFDLNEEIEDLKDE